MLYWNFSLSPTAMLYELGFEGMADQYWELEPMVTVVVAAASVAVDESSSGADGGEPSATVGTVSTVTPNAVEASAAVPRLEESEVCTVPAVVEAGTAMVAVMSTLPAVMVRVTAEASTPAAVAIKPRSEVFLVASKSATLPLAVSVSTTDPVEGGGDGDGDGGRAGGERGTWQWSPPKPVAAQSQA